MKRILVFILAVVLLCACAPKQPKTMEQQAEEARAEAYGNTDSPNSFIDEHGEDILWLLIDGALLSTGNNDTTGTGLNDFTDK